MFNKVLTSSCIFICLSLVGCGGSSSKDDEPRPPAETSPETPPTTPPVTPPTTPPVNPPTTPPTAPSDEEKKFAEQLAKFFLNTVSAEVLGRGLIDRALYVLDEVENDNACQSVTQNNQTYTFNTSCTVKYDVSSSFNVARGSMSVSEDGLTKQYKNFVMIIDGASFQVDASFTSKLEGNAEVIRSSEVMIKSLDTNYHYVLNDYVLKYVASDANSVDTRESSGDFTVLDDKKQELYAVKFNTPTPFSMKRVYSNAAKGDYSLENPTLGKLHIEFKSNAENYLSLTATTNKDIATYYAQTSDFLIANNISIKWSDVLISPASYFLPD